MQFHKFAIRMTLVIAAATGMQSATHASTKYDLLLQQSGLQITQAQVNPPEPETVRIPISRMGQSSFSHPPQLIRSASSQAGSYVPSTYEFTLTVPKDAGQPLKAVTISQSDNLETVKFDVGSSKAFLGKQFAEGSEIRLASVGGNLPSKPGEVTILFDQPIQPGNTVTVALEVQRNPIWSGVYQFGVTAYPIGENSLGQFLGFGRINFYGNAD